jgi:hypothetical protein
VQTDVVHSVNDETADNADAYGQERNEDAESNVPKNNPGPGLPNKVQNSGHVPERANPVAPGVAGTLRAVSLLFTGLAGGMQVTHAWGYAPLGVPPEILVSEE